MPTHQDIPQATLNDLFDYQERVGGGFSRQMRPNPTHYDAILYVFDRKVGDHLELLMLVGVGSVKRHKHARVEEEFEVLGAYKHARGCVLGSGGPVELKKGSKASAKPGTVHGFEIYHGFFLMRAVVRNFDLADIYDPDEVIPDQYGVLS